MLPPPRQSKPSQVSMSRYEKRRKSNTENNTTQHTRPLDCVPPCGQLRSVENLLDETRSTSAAPDAPFWGEA